MIPIAVICGGPSLEHEISLRSGHEILEHIDGSRFAAVP
ncbi:MAG: D-alanine--D-alanine ligase, partial [Planctomycetota bacterium]